MKRNERELPIPSISALPAFGPSLELLTRYQAGDEAALERLIERYLPRLQRIVSVRMGRKLSERVEVDDIVQETLIVAARKIGELEMRDHSSILNWLARIAERQIHDKVAYFGARKRDVAKELRMAPHGTSTFSGPAASRIVGDDASPSLAVARTEFEALVDEHLARLEPSDYREAIVLRDFQQADWEYIRIALGRPTIAAVQELHRRAQIKLRLSLGPRLGSLA
jgi:RNA polymerase sigma factor (sigma-70 family)